MSDTDYKVLKLLHRSKEPLMVGDIAKNLSVPHSTIGSCVKRLELEGNVNYERYKPVVLLDKGKHLAMELMRHTQLLEVLLYNTLGLSKEEARIESEKINLLFSCNIINKICEKYGHPEESPCGEAILNSNNCSCEKHD